MVHLGDITKINGYEVPITDVVVGGSPCQDLSVAGKRAGLDGERSGLFMEQIRLVKEMRDADRRNRGTDVDVRPRYMLWENVPGAFSSNKGEDFRVVLEEVARVAEAGSNNSSWKGGIVRDDKGYILEKCEGHPRAKKCGNYVRQHILVAERMLGRYLTEDEVVHHINHKKDDNRPENLMVMKKSEHISLHHKGKHIAFDNNRKRDSKGRFM